MKAFLLSAGYGTRLKPLTNNIPKCLVPICGKPLLAWWMDLFEKHGINEVLINTHYLADEVREFIEYYNAQKTGVTLIESYEKDLLGSGGTVAINKSFIKNEEKFLICYADNLTNIDLSELIKFHTKKQGILTMGLFYTNNPKECGIAAIDSHDLSKDVLPSLVNKMYGYQMKDYLLDIGNLENYNKAQKEWKM